MPINYFYADPLGGKMPQGFLDEIKLGMTANRVDAGNLSEIYCHDPPSCNGHGTHLCTSLCGSGFSLQAIGSGICGIAAIVSFPICALRPDLFECMLSISPSLSNQNLSSIRYLKNILVTPLFLEKWSYTG